MGCRGSKPRCCGAAGKQRQPKSPRAKGAAAQELTASKRAKAPPAEDAQREKAALLEQQRGPAAKLPRGQQEDGKRWRGKAATQAEQLTQGVGSQVPGQSDVEHEQQLDALKRQHAEALQGLQQMHDQEKLLLTESYQHTQASLQETIGKLNSQLKSFQERMKRVEESILSRDYKKHLQDYGSLSQFWEQELESLHFVIEMKNERIHHLDKKLLTLEAVVERNLQLEEKVKALQQENEDLQVRTEKHLIMTRQLSEELLATRGALEKESQLREQVHREKEELLYRVLNGDAPPTFPLPVAEAPLIAT
ncbi:PREDICTED: coiled-coil domain-containing protein 69 isoform X1 [Crocodylus porosus]|uniref:Coiled-coil domain containing 69 n=1 Tax=Crocodylus porosus TaxID=8502 RepID=A0A7M4FZ32_CROPO|nr:PREDICTED: coiled-coil domain-containing protein 69 isoform X1 [Crocodylus porosus]